MSDFMGADVAKKPKKEPAPPAAKEPDRHKSGLMVRLPESYRPRLAALKAKTRRATTVDLQIALDEHLKKEGIG